MEKYNGIERYIFADVYSLYLKYNTMENTDKAWETFIADGNKLLDKYQKHPLARVMVQAVVSQLEHQVGQKALYGLNHEQWEEVLAEQHKMGI
jgi:neutral trehalase